jgi:hypothetical protein
MTGDRVVVAIDHGRHRGSDDEFADTEATVRTLSEIDDAALEAV